MSEFLDEESQQMDEQEFKVEKELGEGISIHDSINTLSLRKMVLVKSGTTIQSVIELFQSKRVTCVLVGDEKLQGIFTERDVIMKLAGKGFDYNKEIVDDYMTHSPESLRGRDSIAFALNRMTEGGFRHVPVIDDEGKPVAIVSVLDIVRHLAEFFSADVLNLPPTPLREQKSAEGG
ncbi:MAG TPA: CBS domain-containing protein [Candidatus Marinimicrobia bacterium]|jgi:CBS domain-containing protein|nr:CBS domain-containing protein [Candidatus Neomarinimicrobiota bacterium]HIB70769.1 CBS domain-containing protein [Candidatus Neomarinimicrobiota bacterium]HIO56579.1 CBS domain-containing protein [Candidatus Neomarinimicrobiota bacterium]